jgi:hypothetical protein
MAPMFWIADFVSIIRITVEPRALDCEVMVAGEGDVRPNYGSWPVIERWPKAGYLDMDTAALASSVSITCVVSTLI